MNVMMIGITHYAVPTQCSHCEALNYWPHAQRFDLEAFCGACRARLPTNWLQHVGEALHSMLAVLVVTQVKAQFDGLMSGDEMMPRYILNMRPPAPETFRKFGSSV